LQQWFQAMPRRLSLTLLAATFFSSQAFLVAPPSHHRPSSSQISCPATGTRPYQDHLVIPSAFRRVTNSNVEIQEYYSVTEIRRDGDDYVMTTTKFSTDDPNAKTWTVHRKYDQIDEFQRRLNAQVRV